MLKLTSKQNCCGCTACASICPKGCIAMQADEEGFCYPQIDEALCIDCGLCEKVCPLLHKPDKHSILNVYGAKILMIPYVLQAPAAACLRFLQSRF